MLIGGTNVCKLRLKIRKVHIYRDIFPQRFHSSRGCHSYFVHLAVIVSMFCLYFEWKKTFEFCEFFHHSICPEQQWEIHLLCLIAWTFVAFPIVSVVAF